MRNGIVLIGGCGSNGTMRRVFDFEIMDQWPIIPIDKNLEQVHQEWGTNARTPSQHDHISIPPDLEIHFSPSHEFVRKDLVNSNGELRYEIIHLLSWFSRPMQKYKFLNNIKKEGGAMLLFLTPDKLFNNNTGIFVEIYANKLQRNTTEIAALPFPHESMRYVGEKDNGVISIWYKDILRHKKPKVEPKFFLSLRFGFWDNPKDQEIIAVPPQDLLSK